MAIKKSLIFTIPFIFFLICSKNDFNPKLVDYLKGERELRKNVSQNQGLDDSLIVLQKRLGIDIKKELKKLEEKPELWIKVLKAIDGEK
ncbi:MAG: hypothetical protein ABIL46_04895 [candidate division WOR-3 bacterium]